MNLTNLETAIKEAERFIDKAKKVPILHDKFNNGKPRVVIVEYCKESAACKRASMDLTRALARMRKPA